MTGSQFFETVDTWLESKGFYPHMARKGKLDGHALRKNLSGVMSSTCADDGCCSGTYVQSVLDQLKDLPGLTVAQSHSALEAAGFNSDDFEVQ